MCCSMIHVQYVDSVSMFGCRQQTYCRTDVHSSHDMSKLAPLSDPARKVEFLFEMAHCSCLLLHSHLNNKNKCVMVLSHSDTCLSVKALSAAA